MRKLLGDERISPAMLALMFGLAAVNWPLLPDELPIHWSSAVEPDSYAPRAFALLFLPVLAVVQMDATTFDAPWGAALLTTSLLVALLLVANSALLYFAPKLNRILYPEREARGEAVCRLLAVCIPVVALLAAALFMVRGYTVTGDAILVHRLGWSSAVPLDGLESATVSPGAIREASRTRGNGGFLSYTGSFRSRTLGAMQAFVTDHERTVVLRFSGRADGDRVVVMSPDDPDAFAALLSRVPLERRPLQ